MKYWAVGLVMLLGGSVVIAQEPPDLYSSDHAKDAVATVEPQLKAEFQKMNLVYGAPIFVRIFKETRELEVWVQGKDGIFRKFRTYPICDMSGILGPKVEQGDDQSPEGFYTVNADWMHPQSKYHLAFNIGFPNAYDLAHDYTGKAIMVHGKCSSAGCFAMTNELIDQIYVIAAAALTNGQGFFHVHIFPFRMTDANMKLHNSLQWAPFWENLKEGYDLFEKNGVPPNDYVANLHYYFEETTTLCKLDKPCLDKSGNPTACKEKTYKDKD